MAGPTPACDQQYRHSKRLEAAYQCRLPLHAHRQPPRRSTTTPSEGDPVPVADAAAGEDRGDRPGHTAPRQRLADMAGPRPCLLRALLVLTNLEINR